MRLIIAFIPILIRTNCAQYFNDIDIKIWIEDNPMDLIQADSLTHEQDLTEVIIEAQNLTKLRNSTFGNLPRVKSIKIQHTQMECIEEGAFGYLPKIAIINLNFNLLRNLSGGIFNGLFLTKLSVSGNAIDIIQEGALNNLSHLEILDMSRNKIEILPSNLLENTGNLKQIDLSYNKIKKIPDNFFQEAFAYSFHAFNSFIDLGHNRIEKHLNERTFKGVQCLEQLNLESNQIESLDLDIFKDFRCLDKIDLSGNSIMFLTESVLHKLQDSSEINLSDNPWECFFVVKYKKWCKQFGKSLTIDQEMLNHCCACKYR